MSVEFGQPQAPGSAMPNWSSSSNSSSSRTIQMVRKWKCAHSCYCCLLTLRIFFCACLTPAQPPASVGPSQSPDERKIPELRTNVALQECPDCRAQMKEGDLFKHNFFVHYRWPLAFFCRCKTMLVGLHEIFLHMSQPHAPTENSEVRWCFVDIPTPADLSSGSGFPGTLFPEYANVSTEEKQKIRIRQLTAWQQFLSEIPAIANNEPISYVRDYIGARTRAV